MITDGFHTKLLDLDVLKEIKKCPPQKRLKTATEDFPEGLVGFLPLTLWPENQTWKAQACLFQD